VNQKVQDPNNIKSGNFLIHQGKQLGSASSKNIISDAFVLSHRTRLANKTAHYKDRRNNIGKLRNIYSMMNEQNKSVFNEN